MSLGKTFGQCQHKEWFEVKRRRAVNAHATGTAEDVCATYTVKHVDGSLL